MTTHQDFVYFYQGTFNPVKQIIWGVIVSEHVSVFSIISTTLNQ